MRSFKCCHCNTNVVKIHTLKDLAKLADERRSVFVPTSFVFRNPKPAAVVLRMGAIVVLSLINAGLYQYQPKTKHAKGA